MGTSFPIADVKSPLGVTSSSPQFWAATSHPGLDIKEAWQGAPSPSSEKFCVLRELKQLQHVVNSESTMLVIPSLLKWKFPCEENLGKDSCTHLWTQLEIGMWGVDDTVLFRKENGKSGEVSFSWPTWISLTEGKAVTHWDRFFVLSKEPQKEGDKEQPSENCFTPSRSRQELGQSRR